MTSSTFSLFSLSPFLFSFPIFSSHLFLSSRSVLYSSIPSFLFFPSIPFLLLLFSSVFRSLFSSRNGFSSLSLKMGVLHEPCCSEISQILTVFSWLLFLYVQPGPKVLFLLYGEDGNVQKIYQEKIFYT